MTIGNTASSWIRRSTVDKLILMIKYVTVYDFMDF